jgi:carbamoyl-phosphate synthase large subunit
MRTIKILVSAVGGDLGQSVIKCLRKSGYSTYILGCDANPLAAGRTDVEDFHLAPPVKETKKYREFLLELTDKENMNYVFLLSDVEIAFFNEHRKYFEKSPAVFVVNNPFLINTFSDKYLTVQFFQANGIPFPRTWLPGDYKNQLDFPVVLKRRRGSGGRGFLCVQDCEELNFYLKRHSDLIVQEYLPGEENEYTAGLFSDGINKHTITFKRTLAPGGFSQSVELVEAERIIALPKTIAGILDFKGSLNVQFRLTQRGCIPFEINPRFSSTVYFRHLFGFEDVKWSLDMWEGKPVIYTSPKKIGVGVRRLDEVIIEP